MQINKIYIHLYPLLLLLTAFNANAQLNGLQQKAKDKAGTFIEKKTETKVPGDMSPKKSSHLSLGDSLIFAEDFLNIRDGIQNGNFKSNGSIITDKVAGNDGKWMILQDKATYKLLKPIRYPNRFTVEFEILATGDQVKDIAPLSFGFATDNSVKEYTSNVGGYVELHYRDGDQVNFGNSNPKKFLNSTFDLNPYMNRPLHILLEVNDNKMAVYLDGRKLHDGIIFTSGAAKNLYITAPWEYDNGTKVRVSRFKIFGFKH